MDAGEEQIEDESLVARLRAKAKRIHRRALLTATVVTLVVLAFPW